MPVSSMITRPSRQKPSSSQRSYWEVKAPLGSEQTGILQEPDQLVFNQEAVVEQESLEQAISWKIILETQFDAEVGLINQPLFKHPVKVWKREFSVCMEFAHSVKARKMLNLAHTLDQLQTFTQQLF